MIKAVSFDLDGVVFLNGKSNFIFNLLDRGIPESESKRVFFQSDQMRKYKLGLMSDIAYWTWANHEWKKQMSVNDLVDLLISGYELNTKAVEYIRRLRKVGYKALVCTNNFPARILGLDKKFKFRDEFDAIVISYEIGVLKPDRKIFEELAKRARVEPSEIAMADDDQKNIDGATDAGLNAVFYKDFETFTSDLEKMGVTV